MRKILSMALALMMVLSLFAVPTMAATLTEQLTPNGDFESFAAGTTAAGAGFGSSSKTTASVADFIADGLPANGANNTKALKAAINTAGQAAQVRSGNLNMIANEVYTVSFDYIIVADELPNSNYYGVGFSAGGASNAKVYYSNDDGASWSASPATYVNIDAEMVDTDEDGKPNKMATGTWVSFTTKVKSAEARTDCTLVFTSVNSLTNSPADTVAYYIDNISVTREAEAAAITKTITGNGTMTGIADVVGLNTAHTLTLTPASTSYLQSLVIDGNDVTEDVTQTWNSALGNYVGTYNVTVAADTTIVATYADYTLVSKVNDDMESIDYEIGSLTHSTTIWGKSSTGAATVETDATYGQYIKITAGEVRTPTHTMDLGLYRFSFDAKAETAGKMKLGHGAATSGSTGNGLYDGLKAGSGYVNVTTSWAHYDFMFELLAYQGTHTAETNLALSLNMNETTNLCIDNVKIEYYSKTAAPVTPPAPTVYNVTISADANANASVAAATTEGEAVNFTVAPKFGYYIQSITIGGNAFTGFEAYKGGTYSTGAIAADTAIVVTTAALADNDKGVSTDVATLPAAFGSVESSVTFGKVLDNNATSYGVELTQNGQPVLTYHGGGPLYKANTKNANGQYAVEFVGLAAGTYTVRTYVIVDGVKTFGAPATFTVAE